MNGEKIIMFLWGCVTVVFVTMFISSAFLETVKVWNLSNGTTLSLEIGGFAEVTLVVAVYYLSKMMIHRIDNNCLNTDGEKGRSAG